MVKPMTMRPATNETEEKEEEAKAHEATQPTEESIAAYMPLVERIASQVMRRLPCSVQRDDLVAAGTLGLFHALRSSTHTCPEMFIAYARIRIHGAVLDELRKHDWSPRRRKVAGPRPANETGEAPLAPKLLGPSPISVVRFDDLPAHSSAFKLPDEGDSPLDQLIDRSEQEALHAALALLPEREAKVVRLRYFDGMPSKAIAEAMKVSEARVSQLNARATNRLRAILEEVANDNTPVAA